MRKYWLSAGLAVILCAPAATQALAQTPSPAPITAPATAPGGSGSIYTAASVNEFLTDCRADQAGCMAEVGNAFLKHMNDTDDTICLNDINYGTPVPGWLNDHPETHTMPAENGIYLALQKLYPCNSH